VLLPPRLPVAPPGEQLHVGVYVHASHATTACWALQVVEPLQAQAQVHLAELVLAVGTAEGVHVDLTPGLPSNKMQAGRQ
jgi:hypothetical protein